MGRGYYTIFPPTPPVPHQLTVPLPQMTPFPPSGVSQTVKTMKAMRTSKTPLMSQRVKRLSQQMVVRKEIQYLLEDLAETHGSYLVKQELERIASEWGIPHKHDDCFSCCHEVSGDYNFCSLSKYNPEHVGHVCPYFQPCTCRSF
jgi:hypothetical protein